MKYLRVIIPVALIVTIALVSTVVHAQKGMGRGPQGSGELGMLHHILRIGDALDLSEAQVDQIRATLDAAQPEFDSLSEQMKLDRATWAEQNEPTSFDEVAAREFANGQAALQAELMVLGMKTRADVLSVLSPEQIEELQTLRESMKERRGGRRGHGGGGR